jgi:hypothetical protein
MGSLASAENDANLGRAPMGGVRWRSEGIVGVSVAPILRQCGPFHRRTGCPSQHRAREGGQSECPGPEPKRTCSAPEGPEAFGPTTGLAP